LVDLLDARVLAFANPAAADEPPVARAVRAPHAARGPRRLTMLIVLAGVLLCGLVAAAAWAYQSGLLRPRS
jgi:hypothetical protein